MTPKTKRIAGVIAYGIIGALAGNLLARAYKAHEEAKLDMVNYGQDLLSKAADHTKMAEFIKDELLVGEIFGKDFAQQLIEYHHNKALDYIDQSIDAFGAAL